VRGSAEGELCLLLSRGRISPECELRARELLAMSLEWDQILERVKAYQTLPLFYHNLQRLGLPGVPDSTCWELARVVTTHQLRCEILAQELIRLLRLLSRAGIPTIPLKGVTLALELYGDPALRVCSDIDLLVPPDSAARVIDLIVASGYHPIQPFFRGLLLRYGKDCMLVPDGNRPCPVELHWALVWGGPLEKELVQELWSEAQPKAFFGIPAYALSPAWEFLYLAVHAIRHGWTALKWFVDLEELYSRSALNWENVKDKAKRLGWEGVVESSLGACSALLGTPKQPDLQSRVPHLPPEFSDSPLQTCGEILFSSLLLKKPSQRFYFLGIRLFVPTPADGRFIHLPCFLSFMYYPLRVVRILVLVAGWFLRFGLQKLAVLFGRATVLCSFFSNIFTSFLGFHHNDQPPASEARLHRRRIN